MNDNERKKNLHALRSMIIRYRKQDKTDAVAIANFAYEKGMAKKDVEEMYQLIVDAGKVLKNV
jgi:nitrate reductase beta subunit